MGSIAQSFDQASEIAHSRLGLTEEMNKMCNMSVQDQIRLVQVNRWNTVPVTREQSVAEHSWVVAALYHEY